MNASVIDDQNDRGGGRTQDLNRQRRAGMVKHERLRQAIGKVIGP